MSGRSMDDEDDICAVPYNLIGLEPNCARTKDKIIEQALDLLSCLEFIGCLNHDEVAEVHALEADYKRIKREEKK